MPMRFSASAQIKVKFCDFAALAQFANAQGSSQYVKLEGVDWALTEVTKARVQQQVLTEAVQDAVTRASQIANAAGAGQVKALEISDPGLLSGIHGSTGSVDSMVALTARGAAAGAGGDAESLDLVPEDVELAATVHARFTAS